jgi:hypothetical protein
MPDQPRAEQMDADCYFGDHDWRGSSQCRCGARLRCGCGVYVREDNLVEHLAYSCRWVTKELADV